MASKTDCASSDMKENEWETGCGGRNEWLCENRTTTKGYKGAMSLKKVKY